MSSFVHLADDGLSWQLLYTKPHAEAWVEANLRNQGFATLLPRIRTRGGTGALFPRYVFAGHIASQRSRSFAGTFGVAYVVRCGATPALVPPDVIQEISLRMDGRGIVQLEASTGTDSLFSARAQERVATLARFADAGFRVRIA